LTVMRMRESEAAKRRHAAQFSTRDAVAKGYVVRAAI
jgi:hypothetical protein